MVRYDSRISQRRCGSRGWRPATTSSNALRGWVRSGQAPTLGARSGAGCGQQCPRIAANDAMLYQPSSDHSRMPGVTRRLPPARTSSLRKRCEARRGSGSSQRKVKLPAQPSGKLLGEKACWTHALSSSPASVGGGAFGAAVDEGSAGAGSPVVSGEGDASGLGEAAWAGSGVDPSAVAAGPDVAAPRSRKRPTFSRATVLAHAVSTPSTKLPP